MMKKDAIFTVVTVNWNTADFLRVMVEAMTKLSKNPFLFSVMDNGSRPEEMKKLVQLAQEYPEIIDVSFRIQNSTGSINHAEALDILTDSVTTPYTVVMDADCTFLMKDWDQYCIDSLNGNTKIIGTELGSAKEEVKKNNFVFPFAAFFETKTHKELETSAMPGEGPAQDTCWQWQRDYGAAGYGHKTFKVRNTRVYKDGPFADIISAEYYTNETKDDERLVANHFSRGSTMGASKYASAIPIPGIRTWIGKQIGKKEKKIWIEKCREIINAQ